MNGCELVVRACFDSAFAFEVDDHGALFGLQRVVPARAHQAVNHVVKRVVVVVEQNKVPFIVKQHVRQDVFLGLGFRTANTEHGAIFRVVKIAGHASVHGFGTPSCGNSNLNGIKVFLIQHPLP